ncbi:MAG: M1 family metallopeptidase [Cytophagaceae bacterium]|nr:M1 family metallopeptidase [Cytophagaceae bacterium]
MKYFLLAIILITQITSEAQFSIPENKYRTVENRHYWKNRPPYEGYWQQDVHYIIDAHIDDTTDIIHGNFYQLTYWNNSPFTLNELYFHLYQNAFQPGSYYHDLKKNNHIKDRFGKYEEQGLGTIIEHLKINGKAINRLEPVIKNNDTTSYKIVQELDNTVLWVALPQPLKPGDSVVVTCKFKTYFDPGGTMRRRMNMFKATGGDADHFNGVHWYPTICVYDKKFSWHTDQDLDKEYYNNFGTFDVRLTFPQEYVVEATGNLINREEVLPDSLRQKLDLSNFKKKPEDGKASIITPREYGKMKTWQYHAENVHNFAFTADPSYRIGEVSWKGVKCIALAQEPNAWGWQASAWFTAQVIKIYSEDFGMYDWPKVIVSDANDGMEYPMITLDGGTYPSHAGTLAHEVGHMWFYGMVASNETYRASLDEGFTQFLTVWSMDKIYGEKRPRASGRKYYDKHLDSSDTRYESLYYPYLSHVLTGFDEPLNTHSQGFNGAIRHGGGYGLVYYKTGVMLYNLKYVLGDTLFLNAMKHYVNKWKFCHPYPEDFRDAITEYTQTDLTWFFDQWLETTKYIDYSIKNIKVINKGISSPPNDPEARSYSITFERKGRMEMPVDFVVTTDKGNKYKYHIPNRWFEKKSSNAVVLAKWYGWDLLHPTYTTTIKVQPTEKIKTVEIDPQHYLADIDLTNNKKGKGGIHRWQFKHFTPNTAPWAEQRNFWSPALWYNFYDGVQIGPHIEGKYFGKHVYSASAWFNTGLGQYLESIPENIKNDHQLFAFNIYNENITRNFLPQSKLYEQAYYNAGIWKMEIGFEKTFRKQDQKNPRYSRFFIKSKYLINDLSNRYYLLYRDLWGPQHVSAVDDRNYINGVLDLGYSKVYNYQKGTGAFTITLRTPSIGSDYNYGYLSLNSINRINWKKFEIGSRVFGQWGVGNFPYESSLYLAGANPESLIDNRFTQARGFFPTQWLNYGADINHFHYGGGLNLRGYAGYLSPEGKNVNGSDTIHFAYFGNSGMSYNLEIDFDKYVKIPAKGITKNLKLDTYIFADAGIINYKQASKNYFGKVRTDAGIGTALTIKFAPYDIKSLVVRFDMPFFLNSPPAVSDYFEFRYILSINRAF